MTLETAIHAVGRFLLPLVQWGLADQDRAMECGEILLAVGTIVLVYRCPAWLAKLVRRSETALVQFYGRRKTTTILLIGLFPVMVRLALLPVVPIPIPYIADEMSHLLLADTIASGRVVNPPHPLAPHFEATYVSQRPAYSSVYPPAHGFVMGLVKLAGLHPWYGVLVEMCLMAMAITWMLEAWFPPRWVLVGSLVAVVRLGIWMTSYWGGLLTAAGGALVVGSLKRIWDRPRAIHCAALSLGLTILVNTRPYEAALVGLAVAVTLGFMFRAQRLTGRPAWRKIGAAFALSLAAGLAITGYYNWRVTENPSSIPYSANRQQHGTPAAFVFEPPVPEPPGIRRFKDLSDNYAWQRDVYNTAKDPNVLWKVNSAKLATFWHFYLHPLLVIPLLALPWILRRRSMGLLLFAGLFVSFGTALYPFYFAHYSAPLAGLLIILLVQGLRHVAIWSRGRPGGGLSLAPVIKLAIGSVGATLVLFALFFHEAYRSQQRSMYPALSLMRHQIEQRLEASGQKHLVLVRYRPDHNYHFGMTYNRARIDEAPVVWARELDAGSNANLLRYYQERTAWLYEPDENPPRIQPLPGQTAAAVRPRIMD